MLTVWRRRIHLPPSLCVLRARSARPVDTISAVLRASSRGLLIVAWYNTDSEMKRRPEMQCG